MSRSEAWLVHLASFLVVGTGALWALMLYALEPADEFALQNHPLQDETQAAHILVAPLLVLALGFVWAVHARPHLAAGTRTGRRTGLTLLALAVPMAVSGYTLQVSVDESWRATWLVVHLATSAAWTATYVVHQLARRRTSGVG